VRIVSLLPGVTETVHALGLAVGLAGRAQECARPPTVAAVPVVGRRLAAGEAAAAGGPPLVADPAARTAHDHVSRFALDSAALAAARPDVAVADCMLPAALAAARAAGTPAVSLVHFLYGLARTQMLRGGGAFTTDLQALADTQRALGLPAPRDGLDAWEAPELLLVAAPPWLDLDAGAPAHVVHAGPLDVRPRAPRDPRRVLLTFSTTVMEGQPALVERACAAVAGLDAVLTLGPALDVRAPGIEVLASADHDVLLPGCTAVVGHGGLGTVLRALVHGVPQVLLPLGRDQAFNADRVEELGAGIRLDPAASPAEIRAAVRRVTEEPRFAAAAAAAAERIVREAPDRSAAERIERLASR
jgi:UDP:flavonoid glycosyltransferase YjiC (YdhE family)